MKGINKKDEVLVEKPLDFSFQNVRSFLDLLEAEPSSGYKKQTVKPTTKEEQKTDETKFLNAVFALISHVSTKTSSGESISNTSLFSSTVPLEILTASSSSSSSSSTAPSSSLSSTSTDSKSKSSSSSSFSQQQMQQDTMIHITEVLKLNDNAISSWDFFSSTLHAIIYRPTFHLRMLDLSRNQLTTIDPALLSFENLNVLYLHGNNITDIKEVDKLSKMRTLNKLTLHGNEVAEESIVDKRKIKKLKRLTNVAYYRPRVVYTLRTCALKSLDFNPITPKDIEQSYIWAQNFSAAAAYASIKPTPENSAV
eukprot:TRINITY_DN1572_c2_g1_i2.p1 TRINITY_DN1572_c2_g1~~TRINITY_DN1572_c2_g1_i2.p1  ORF type:complete len:310 (+),score=73.80 TRINITY_DN1572_c2_g1_i2:297-1226(+)